MSQRSTWQPTLKPPEKPHETHSHHPPISHTHTQRGRYLQTFRAPTVAPTKKTPSDPPPLLPSASASGHPKASPLPAAIKLSALSCVGPNPTKQKRKRFFGSKCTPGARRRSRAPRLSPPSPSPQSIGLHGTLVQRQDPRLICLFRQVGGVDCGLLSALRCFGPETCRGRAHTHTHTHAVHARFGGARGGQRWPLAACGFRGEGESAGWVPRSVGCSLCISVCMSAVCCVCMYCR